MPTFRYSLRLHRAISTGPGAHRSSNARLLSHHPQRLDELAPLACRLRSRSVLRVRGPDTVKFLQNLVTNDVRPLAQTSAAAGDDRSSSPSYSPTLNLPLRSLPPIYAAMLTPEGRFLYDLFLYRQPRPEEEKLYRTGSGPGPEEEPLTVLADVDATVLDELLDHLRKGRSVAIPLEYNIAGLNAISFNKGCYVGQELIARTHHRGIIRKRLLPLKFVDDSGNDVEQEASPGSEVVDGASHKKIGNVTTVMGCRGMGLLRLEEALKRSPTLRIKEKDGVKVEVIKPDWWPAEWTQA